MEKISRNFFKKFNHYFNIFLGFILNRILMPYINEAIYAIYEGVASIEDIDKGVKLGTNGKIN